MSKEMLNLIIQAIMQACPTENEYRTVQVIKELVRLHEKENPTARG